MSDRRRLCGLLLIGGGIAYAGVVTEALFGWPLGVERSYLSEMAAADQSYGTLFRAGDVVAGLAVLLAAILLVVSRGGDRRDPIPGPTSRAVAVALGIFGAATVADALFPLDCAVSRPECAAAEAAGTLSTAHTIHAGTSTVAGVAIAAASALLVLPLLRRRAADRRAPSDGTAPIPPTAATAPSRWLTVLSVGIVVTLTAQTVSHLVGGPTLGSVQRIQVVLVCLLLISLGTGLLRRPRRPAAVEAPRTSGAKPGP